MPATVGGTAWKPVAGVALVDPLAGVAGWPQNVAYPAINPASEMVDLMGAVRAYQLNASAVSAAKQMIQESIDILKTT